MKPNEKAKLNSSQLDLPDRVYNWPTEFFSGHTRCTKYQARHHLSRVYPLA